MPDFPTNQARATKKLLLNENLAVRELARNYAAVLDDIRLELVKLYERYSVDGVLTHAEMSKYNRLAALEHELTTIVRPVNLKNARVIEKISSVQYEEAFYRHAWSIDQAVGVNLRWGLLNPATIEAAVANPLRQTAVKALNANELLRINRAIRQGLIRGSSLPRMMRDIKATLQTTAYEAMRIARTEAHRAREIGNLAASEKAVSQGVNLMRQWDASLDNRTRNSHARLDGVQRAPGKAFPGGALYPGGFGIASEDINCRCTLVDIVEGLEPELRRTREDGVQPYQTFSQWAQSHGVTGSRYGEKYNFVKR